MAKTKSTSTPAADAGNDVTPTAPAPKGKLGILVGLLAQPEGATIEAMQNATGWQAHSIRGAIAGTIKKKLGLSVVSAKEDDVRVYRIVEVGNDAR